MTKKKYVDCFKCKHFYITWDQKNPRGCRFFSFKTKLIPSTAVLRSSGKVCEAFIQKSKGD